MNIKWGSACWGLSVFSDTAPSCFMTDAGVTQVQSRMFVPMGMVWMQTLFREYELHKGVYEMWI